MSAPPSVAAFTSGGGRTRDRAVARERAALSPLLEEPSQTPDTTRRVDDARRRRCPRPPRAKTTTAPHTSFSSMPIYTQPPASRSTLETCTYVRGGVVLFVLYSLKQTNKGAPRTLQPRAALVRAGRALRGVRRLFLTRPLPPSEKGRRAADL